MKILVTGGCGFIGSHIVEHFQGKADVKVLDNLRSGFRHNLDGFDVDIIEGSIMDQGLLRDAVRGIDFVFHLAAMVSVPESMHNPVECTEINTIGTLNVLEAAASANVKKLSLSSSSAVYGNNPIVPKVESMIPEPKSPYAISKLDGEYYCKLFNDEGWLKTVCLRYFNVFGPRQDPGSQYAAAVPIFIDKALKNEPLTVYGDGEQTRDFVYVKDIVEANRFLTTETTDTGVYNIAYGKKIAINDLAGKIIELTESKSDTCYMPERPGDVLHSLASIDKLKNTGIQLADEFDNGLTKTIDYFRKSNQSV